MALNILVVDDSTAIRKILIRALRQTALAIGEIFEARDGLEALEIVRNHSLNLVLSDINMPNLDGLGLLAELKGSEQWRDLPVVMITTEGSEEKVGQAIRLGSAAYIRKPFTAPTPRFLVAGLPPPGWSPRTPALPPARQYPAQPAKIIAPVTGSWRRVPPPPHILRYLAMELRLLPGRWHAEPFVGHLGTLHGPAERPPEGGGFQHRQCGYPRV